MTPPKVLGSIWYGSIGIVAVESYEPDHSWKVYIGEGYRADQTADEQLIARGGMPLLHKEAACAFFPQLKPEGYRY